MKQKTRRSPSQIRPAPDRQAAASRSTAPAAASGPKARWLGWLVPLALLAAAAGATAVDCRLSHWLVTQRGESPLADLLVICETFGHALGVLLIVTAVWVLDPARRWALPRVMASAYGGGLAADLVKMTIVRIRPYQFDFQGGVWATFGRWLPLAGAGSTGQSFPSAHTATAFGLAMALGWLYPRGRWFFVLLAVLVGCQRMASGAHYLSDVLVGAALGIAVARVCLARGWATNWMDRWQVPLEAVRGRIAEASYKR